MIINFRSALRSFALACTLGIAGLSGGEEFRLPDSGELETFSRDAMPLYISGVASLDRSDYGNAYSSLAKAAQLQPDAARLNQIVAALALKLGRSRPAVEARGYYETAISSYENVLRQQSINERTRRDVTNKLKVAVVERNDLEPRDGRRESIGTYFIMELNREFAAKSATPAPSTSPTPAPAVGVSPGATPIIPGAPVAGAVIPGVNTMPGGMPAPTPGYPTAGLPPAVPGFPGTTPPLPGGPTAPIMPVPAPAGVPEVSPDGNPAAL